MTSSNTASRNAAPASRRRRQSAEVQRAILAATEELLVEDGYEAFSMRRLSARCGYTAPTLYHHFGDKQHLLDAVVEARFQLVVGRLRSVQRRPDPADTVRAMLSEFVRFAMENPDHFRLLDLPRPADAEPPPSAEECRALLEAPLARIEAQGRLLAAGVEEATQYIWAVVTGLLNLTNGWADTEWSPTLVDFTLDAALRGLILPADAPAAGPRNSR